jgi:type VI secretion system protein ImpK
MKLSLWKMVISLRRDIANLLERTIQHTVKLGERASAPALIPQETLERMRGELKTQLDTLKDSLTREMGENEVYLVMFPLVLLCDEMVMSQLGKPQQTMWPLLQADLFQINYGGDVFYDFVDERLAKPDTPAVVFEVMYYCLASGFVGKFGSDSSKVLRYKSLLTERIPGALTLLRKKKRRRDGREKTDREDRPAAPPIEAKPKRRSSAWYYLAMVLLLILFVGSMLVVSNL